MTLKEKLELFKKRGWTYNLETGEIHNQNGKLITGQTKGYIICTLRFNKKNVSVYSHSLAYYLTTDEVPNVIDHINHNTSDNRFINLRNGTTQLNQFNRTAKGYYFHKGAKKWRAQIKIDGKVKAIGSFHSEEEARKAYLEAKMIYHRID